MSRIPISQKHGVNPTIPICFWCGETKNEIALLGRLPGDKEAPPNCIIDYEPCDKCKGNWAKGIAILRATHYPPREGMPPIQGDIRRGNALWVDGRHVVVTVEGFGRIFGMLGQEEIDAAKKAGRILLEDKAFDGLFLNLPEPPAEEEETVPSLETTMEEDIMDNNANDGSLEGEEK